MSVGEWKTKKGTTQFLDEIENEINARIPSVSQESNDLQLLTFVDWNDCFMNKMKMPPFKISILHCNHVHKDQFTCQQNCGRVKIQQKMMANVSPDDRRFFGNRTGMDLAWCVERMAAGNEGMFIEMNCKTNGE